MKISVLWTFQQLEFHRKFYIENGGQAAGRKKFDPTVISSHLINLLGNLTWLPSQDFLSKSPWRCWVLAGSMLGWVSLCPNHLVSFQICIPLHCSYRNYKSFWLPFQHRDRVTLSHHGHLSPCKLLSSINNKSDWYQYSSCLYLAQSVWDHSLSSCQ